MVFLVGIQSVCKGSINVRYLSENSASICGKIFHLLLFKNAADDERICVLIL